ncbi:VanZ family protein [Diplocloster modestus]|uniref:VanZ family protein n=1 Tax=Diplocloster modestus TaxID=2850322 RepID=A0ABS6KE72_9FIRM|nr:VanZ family protein [Diplocloster modestus]MBU9728821.1 VanZ family protein [Diplocloster modestus]
MRQDRKRTLILHGMGSICFLLCVYVVFKITGISPLSGFHTDIRIEEINVIPLWGILDLFLTADGWEGIKFALINVIGNVLLFCPLGFLLPLLWEKYAKWWKTLAAGAGLSVLIECTQLFLIRGTDVDDVLLNSLGALIGYGAYRLAGNLQKEFCLCFRIIPNKTWEIKIRKLEPWIYIALAYIGIIAAGFYKRYLYLQM